MSDGMSEYWRAKRAQAREEKIKMNFYIMITSLLWNRPSLKVVEDQSKRMLANMFETMKCK